MTKGDWNRAYMIAKTMLKAEKGDPLETLRLEAQQQHCQETNRMDIFRTAEQICQKKRE